MDTKEHQVRADQDMIRRPLSDAHNAPGPAPQRMKGDYTMSMDKMESKIRELRSLQRLIEEAEQEVEAIKDVIKAQLTAQGLDELQAGEYRVIWKAVSSSRLDGKALKAALPDVAERFTATSTTRRFCVA